MFNPCEFTDAEKFAAFDATVKAVEVNLELGRLCIVEGMPFSRVGEYEAIAEAAEHHGRSALPVVLAIEPSLAAERISSDKEQGTPMAVDRDSHLPLIVSRRLREPPPDALVLDASQSPQAVSEAALRHIREANGHRPPQRQRTTGEP